jgi:preprotein translocase subunit SecD
VRGFAFFLGISTLLDLIISYFFMHPLVSILARRRALVRAPKVGIAAGLDVQESAAMKDGAMKDGAVKEAVT